MAATLWNSLNPELLSRMQDRLGTHFGGFATACEKAGLLEESFLKLDKLVEESLANDVGFLCATCASAVVSAANHCGGQGQLDMAKRLASWAVMLEPNHLPAFQCLATIYDVEGNTKEAETTRAHFDEIKDRLLATPESELSSFEKGTLSALAQLE